MSDRPNRRARIDDLALLDSVVALTRRRVTVDARDAFEHAHGYRPRSGDLVELRLAVLRLERDGLVLSDRELRLEATPDGEVAVELHRAARLHSSMTVDTFTVIDT